MQQTTTSPIPITDQPTHPLVSSPRMEIIAVPPVGSAYLLLITPSDEEQTNAIENFFQAIGTEQPFALELVGTRREQGFVLRASSEDQLVLLSKQLQALYPQAELSRIAPNADPLILHPGEHAVIGTLVMTQKPWMPLKTFKAEAFGEPGADPLAGILAAIEPLGSQERCVAQLALASAPEHWIARDIRKSVEHPLQAERDAVATKGKSASDTEQGIKTLLLVGGLFGTLLAYRWYTAHAWFLLILLGVTLLLTGIGLLWWKVKAGQQNIYDMKLVAEKLSRQAFYTRLRIIAIGQQSRSTKEQLQAHVKRLEAAYRQFTLASANSLTLKGMQYLRAGEKQTAKLPNPMEAFPYRTPILRFLYAGALSPDIWNSLELAGAFHLPEGSIDLPLVRRLSVKHLLASPEIAYQIERTPAPLPPALIGYSQHRGFSIPVYLPYPTLFSHKFLVARSTYGKSTLIQLLTQAAMQPVRDHTPQPGVFVIDPHKDLIEDLLRLIPPQRTKDVVLLDLTDTRSIVALNPLDATMGFTRDQAVANLMSSFERVWSDFWGPRMAYFLKAVCLLLYTLNEQKIESGHADEQYTLLDINPLLQYPDFAGQVLHELDMSETWHQELLAWWQNVYFALPKNSSFRSEVIMPIVSKLGIFQDNQQLRRIVGQPITRAPIHVAVTEGKIVLCALSSRDMDDAAVNVLGSTLINLLHRAFRLQEPLPLLARRKVFCAVDEFHAFSGGDFDRLLSEDGKFGAAMLLATQNLKRLNKIRDGLLEMVFSNCENLCAFNVSAADAKLLEEELRKVVEQRHIISQPRLHCYARLMLPGYPLQIVSVTLARPPSWKPAPERERQAEELHQQYQRHNAQAPDIDRRYAEHMARFLYVTPFAQMLQREAQATQQSKEQREKAEQLAEEQRMQQRQSQPEPPQKKDQKQQRSESDGTPASIGSSLAGGTSPQGGPHDPGEEAQDKDRNPNHPRSKRGKYEKDAVGVSPPPPQDPLQPKEYDYRPRFPLHGLFGRSFWGSERERGE
jgi:hypothetical protein